MRAGAVLLLFACACSPADQDAGQEPAQILENFTMNQSRGPAPLWKLKAPSAVIALQGSAELKLPEIDFFQNGRHASTATSDTASVKNGTRDITLEGNVVIRSREENAVLRTARLDYDAARDRFRTDQSVEIERPGAKLRGSGMEGDPALSEVVIYDQKTVMQK